MWQAYVEAAAAEHDQCDEVVHVAEPVRHADGDLDPAVECLEPRVGVSEPDGPEDVGPASPDLLRELHDLGDAAVGRPEHPVVRFAPGLFDRVPEQRPEEFLEPPRAVELSRGVGVPDRVERLLLPVGQVLRILQHRVPDTAQALRLLPVAVAARLVPQSFPDPVERVAHPRDDAQPVQYARGRTRTSRTGSGRSGESTMRASSTTTPLTLRSRLNMLSVGRFSGVVFLGR